MSICVWASGIVYVCTKWVVGTVGSVHVHVGLKGRDGLVFCLHSSVA